MADTFLDTAILRIRFAADEPVETSKYTNAELIKHFIEPAYADVVSDISMTSDACVQHKFTLSIVEDTEFYILPPNIRRITQIVQYDDEGHISNDWFPLSPYNVYGPNWTINGNTLQFRPLPRKTETWYILYEPNGDVRLNNGSITVGSATGEGTSNMILPASPTKGSLDMRPNAYVGSVFRVLTLAGSDTTIQERVITSWTPSTRVVEFRNNLSPTFSNTNVVTYEIAPPVGPNFQDVWAMRATLKLLAYKGVNMSNYQQLLMEYRRGMKTLRDNYSNLNARTGKRFQNDTMDSNDPVVPAAY